MNYDLIVIGAGASGIMAAIVAAKDAKKVLLLEKLPQIAAKLKATGGGRCNLSNTLSDEDFMQKFGRDGRFMQDALKAFNHEDLKEFFKNIGVTTHAPDGFRIFPTSHNSSSIIKALQDEMLKLNIEILNSQKVVQIIQKDSKITTVKTQTHSFKTTHVVVASGGLGYPVLGAEGDGYEIAKELGHKVTKLHPAMMPLKVKEDWVKNCRADTIAKVQMKVDIKKYSKLKALGDLIFTKNGIRGPVVLDFAREVTPLLQKYDELPILMNLTKGKNEEQITKHIKNEILKNPKATILELISTLLPKELSLELIKMAKIDLELTFAKIDGAKKAKLLNLLAWTPLNITGHDGFKMAMITRGGINLKEINPKTMQSKIVEGLYFCGEVINIDGPCGGYNLQWAFSSGFLAGKLL